MRKKLQTYNGIVAYKADKTPIKRAFYGRTKADARQKYEAYIAERGQPDKHSDLYTVAGWAAQWLLLYKRPYITDPAYSTTYELPIRRHILPALGHMLLVDVTPADILRVYRAAAALSPSMCGKIRMCVNGIFRSAASNGLCTGNPADGCRLESMAAAQIKEVYNDKQIEIASRWFLYRMPEVVLLLETGMRRGELIGLYPEDIDRRRKVYQVRRSIAWVHGEAVERPPKCRSYRVCPLSDRALQAVDMLLQRSSGRYLISGETALRPDTWSRRLRAEMARMAEVYPAVPQLTAHELRHTYGTYLRRHGADIYSISKILGHRDINVTARIYVHNEIAELRKAVRWCNRREPIREEPQHELNSIGQRPEVLNCPTARG